MSQGLVHKCAFTLCLVKIILKKIQAKIKAEIENADIHMNVHFFNPITFPDESSEKTFSIKVH